LPRRRWSYNIVAVTFKHRKRGTLQKKRIHFAIYLTVIVTNIIPVLFNRRYRLTSSLGVTWSAHLTVAVIFKVQMSLQMSPSPSHPYYRQVQTSLQSSNVA
jgi:hypothetical protein